jgi:hypothetical protein
VSTPSFLLYDNTLLVESLKYCVRRVIFQDALGKSGKARNAEKAEQILDEMEYMSSTYGFRELAPNTICYNSVITAYARSTSVSKAYRAELLLERMIEGSNNGNSRIRPNAVTFNSVINAAAQSFYGDEIVKKEAYLIALNAFKTLHGLDDCKPTSVTYSTFLKALQNLIYVSCLQYGFFSK